MTHTWVPWHAYSYGCLLPSSQSEKARIYLENSCFTNSCYGKDLVREVVSNPDPRRVFKGYSAAGWLRTVHQNHKAGPPRVTSPWARQKIGTVCKWPDSNRVPCVFWKKSCRVFANTRQDFFLCPSTGIVRRHHVLHHVNTALREASLLRQPLSHPRRRKQRPGSSREEGQSLRGLGDSECVFSKQDQPSWKGGGGRTGDDDDRVDERGVTSVVVTKWREVSEWWQSWRKGGDSVLVFTKTHGNVEVVEESVTEHVWSVTKKTPLSPKGVPWV
jgi:hypothetical protein